jgi:hypothetical protein
MGALAFRRLSAIQYSNHSRAGRALKRGLLRTRILRDHL